MGRFTDTFVDESPEVSSTKNRFSDTFVDGDVYDLENFTYTKFQESPELRRAAVRFAKAHLGYDNPSAEKAISETVEHFREFNVNELTAAGDWNYVSGLKADAEAANDYNSPEARKALEDYKALYEAYDALPNFGEGSAPDAFVDYAAGLLQAPSTYAGILLPGAGKAAGVAAQATSKLMIGRALSAATKTPLRAAATAAAVEGTAGVLQDVSGQKALIAADVQDEFSVGQTAFVGGLSAALPLAPGLGFLKDKTFKYVERNTGDLVKISEDAIQKRVDRANRNVDSLKKDKGKVGTFNTVSDKLKALNEEAVTAGRETLGDMARTEGLDKNIRLAVDPKKLEQVSAALTDILATRGGLNKGERITEGLARVLRGLDDKDISKQISSVFDDTLTKYNLTFDDLANIIMADVSDSARILQKAGQAKKNLKAQLGNFSKALNDVANYDLFGFDIEVREAAKKAREAVDKNDVRKYLTETSRAREIDAARLAFMTSQTATTVRNVASGAARVGFDTLTRAVDRGLRKFTKQDITTAGQEDVFAVFSALTNEKEAVAIETIFAMGFEKEATRLFRMLQDIGDASYAPNKMTRLANASRQLNALNTITDNVFKRAALVGNLKRALNEQYTNTLRNREALQAFQQKFGKMPTEEDFNLVEVMKKGRFNDVFGSASGQEALKNAVDEALYFTYQQPPNPGGMGELFVKAVHKVPFVGTAFMPFPRFVLNALRHTFEYSPTYLLYGKGRNELLNVAKPIVGMTRDETITSYQNAAKGLVGTGFLLAGAAFRMSPFAGENWYEGRTFDGKTFDMRPFFPAAPFLFFGDLLQKTYKQNVLGEPQVFIGDRSIVTDAIQALTGTQFRAGMGLYTLDALANDLINIDDVGDTGSEVASKLITEWAANTVSTFTIPLTFGQDMYNTFLAPDDERIARNLQSRDMMSLFINKSLSRIPANYALEKKLEESGLTNIFTGAKYKAPEARKPATKRGRQRRVTPVTRQMMGLLKSEKKTALEKELDKHRIRRSDVYGGKTEIPEYDELYAVLLDDFVAEKVEPFVQSEDYKKYDSEPALQAKLLKEKLRYFKEQVRKTLRGSNVNKIMQKRYGFNPKAMLDYNRRSQIFKERAMERYLEAYEEPETEQGYDFNILLQLAKEEEAKVRGEARSDDPNPIQD
ncbi:MAG: hypothetical protein CBB98_09710 [Rhodobacteraceae bacterium TMED38]|nr:MAG: hypothetical protein CBB98_09710 [Rhodobacteraceae bacterium TMED38]